MKLIGGKRIGTYLSSLYLLIFIVDKKIMKFRVSEISFGIAYGVFKNKK